MSGVSWAEHGDIWWTEAMDGDMPRKSDFDDEEGPCRCSTDGPCECPRICDGCGKLSDDVGPDGFCEPCTLAEDGTPEEVAP